MPKPATFDVWFVTADQVYKGVPFQVVAGWVEQGRVSGNDQVRPAASNVAWVKIGAHPLLADYLTPTVTAHALPARVDATPVEPLEAPEVELAHRRPADDDDDDVDMIPLIDISLVLLIFFMMTTAVSALSPVDVPAISNGSDLSKDDDALTIHIDIDNDVAFYAVAIGDNKIAPENNKLETLDALNARLNVILTGLNRPPEVRIACHKKLKHVRVRELAVELEKRKTKGQIAFYRAEVNEQPKQ